MGNENIKFDLTMLSTKVDEIIKKVIEVTNNSHPILGGEHFLTDAELSCKLKVSRRTLQQWRSDGVVPYILLGGKVLYRESDINTVIENHYIEAYKCE